MSAHSNRHVSEPARMPLVVIIISCMCIMLTSITIHVYICTHVYIYIYIYILCIYVCVCVPSKHLQNKLGQSTMCPANTYKTEQTWPIYKINLSEPARIPLVAQQTSTNQSRQMCPWGEVPSESDAQRGLMPCARVYRRERRTDKRESRRCGRT